MRFTPLLLVVLLAGPSLAGAVAPLAAPAPTLAPDAVAGPLGLPTEAVVDIIMTNVSDFLGEDLTREDVRLGLDLDFRTLDFDLVGMVFGGGTLEANARLSARLELRAISVGRINDAIDERTGGMVNLSTAGINASRQVIAADEFRSLLAGEALAAFEEEQERLVQRIIEDSFPDLNVQSTRFEWTNTNPLASVEGDLERGMPRLTEPPIVLDVTIDLQVLRRESLADLIADAMRKKRDEAASPDGGARAASKDAREALIEQLRAENEGAFYERSAFSRMGITQLVVLRMEPGWDLDLNMQLPKGFTFEYASADVDVTRDLDAAAMGTYARTSNEPVPNPVAVSISNRYLVTVALLVVVLVAGTLVRIPVILAANFVVARRTKRMKRSRSIPVEGAPAPQVASDVLQR